ncbi:MAG TPA: bifunctional riboflavin kinase/FAD synthetase [Burkholderiales bacterium]|nr:bifunctional riboflavin kinase/FAD synthetase [Burkholderiales bacterium]
MVVTHGFLPAFAGRGWAVTIGNFDGVHRGHRALLDRVNARARELDIGSCVLTFEPHPREFFAADAAPPRLTRLRDKLELLAAAGVGRVHVARFGARLASLSAGEFIDTILVRGLQARALVVGRDFRFGKGRGGDVGALRGAGLEVEALPDVVDGERISSSGVRAALQAGDLRRAERLLGHPYVISGRVVRGAGLGRQLGCPTANIPLPRKPALAGIFVVHVEGHGRGVASLGLRPTVNPLPTPLLEVHLLDVERDLYGRRLKVRFLAKLRDEQKYDDLEALKSAISTDVRNARHYFENHG